MAPATVFVITLTPEKTADHAARFVWLMFNWPRAAVGLMHVARENLPWDSGSGKNGCLTGLNMRRSPFLSLVG